MDVARFMRLFQMRATQVMWLLGAGTSRTAGVKTAWDVIWDLKHKLYCSQKKLALSAITDLSDVVVQRKIQEHFDSLGSFPSAGAEDEYSAYFEAAYAMRSDAGPASRYAICCSQVFDAEGSGMEFVAYEASDVRMFGKNPFLRRDQMLKVISRSLLIYQRKHAGQSPRRIVVHKNTEFKPEEAEGCFDALPRTDAIDLVHVQQSSGWRGMHIPEPRKPHGYPVHRGTALQLGAYETLLWTQGNLPVVANDRDYFKEGKGIPEPLMLVRYAGNGSMDDLCRQTLGLTKMDWNNDGPYDRLPVTLNFAQTLAKVVVRMPTLEPRSYPFRLFMNPSLRRFEAFTGVVKHIRMRPGLHSPPDLFAGGFPARGGGGHFSWPSHSGA